MTLLDTGTLSDQDVGFSKRARQGVFWLFGSSGVEQVLGLVVTMVLARLLTPAEYGLLGMAMIVIGFLGRFSNFGTDMAMIQARELDRSQLSSVFWFNIGIALIIGLVMVLSSPFVAHFFGEPRVIPIMAVLALTMPLQALSIVHGSLLRRQLQFDSWVIRNLASVLASGILGIAVAWLGGGVWALVVQQIAQPLIITIVLWRLVRWTPLMQFRFADIHDIREFTLGAIGFSILNYLSRNVDNLLVGRFLGPVALGYYTLAYRLMLYPVRNIAGVASQSLFPVFSRLQDDKERLSKAFIRASQYISIVTFPVMIGLSMNAKQILILFYGEQWLAAAPTLMYLSLVGMYQPIVSLYGSVLWAKGYARWQVNISLIKTMVTMGGFVLGLRWGISGVALCYLITETLLTCVLLPIMFKKCSTNLRDFLGSIAIPTIGTTIMAIVLFLLSMNVTRFSFLNQSALLQLTVNIVVGIIVYSLVLVVIGRELRKDVLQDFKILITRKPGRNQNVKQNASPLSETNGA